MPVNALLTWVKIFKLLIDSAVKEFLTLDA